MGVLGHLHQPLEGFVVVDRAILVPGRDATGQDAPDSAGATFGAYPEWHAEFLQLPWEFKETVDKSGGVDGP
jgi:hypothetical protein